MGLKNVRKASHRPAGYKAAPKPKSYVFKSSAAPALAPEPVGEPIMQEFLGLGLLALKPAQCRYPRGDQAPFEFCAQPVVDGHSYCLCHYNLTHTPSQMRRWPSFHER
jgi:hypothetical protein